MLFKNAITSTAIAALALFVDASPVKRDTWSPRIIEPNAWTTWVSGTRVNVTWDTSNAPERISSGSAGPTVFLARGFDLRQGWVEVTVPWVEPSGDYTITLFGSSDNRSPYFYIAAPTE
ncbi:hypothetical protein VNI00_012115 [Paramarasmius palmivorus]|uniref:Ser-Thr-rich glycosyl-phosphatidyl-inositol-anchored membrane family-domain-containing protein n=1 Tax=Paramarasmius palmivorus TaxID=297713 RepID=A0AAW0C6K4_9AGAR